jgi:transcriptional regulator with XRE-family HTH domain
MTDAGGKVKRAREAAGLSQEDLARAADLSVYTISKLENGGNVRSNTLRRIARALKKDVDEFLGSPAVEAAS